MAFLALIGLLVILWIAQKFFKFLGLTFDTLAQDLTNKAVIRVTTKRKHLANIKKVKEKIDTIKGNGTDQEYWNNVRNNIDNMVK